MLHELSDALPAHMHFRAESRLAGMIYGLPFGVDAGFDDVLTQVPEIITGTRFLDFIGVAPAQLRVYPRETHVAEKLHAYTLLRARENSRVKDLPTSRFSRRRVHLTTGSCGMHSSKPSAFATRTRFRTACRARKFKSRHGLGHLRLNGERPDWPPKEAGHAQEIPSHGARHANWRGGITPSAASPVMSGGRGRS